MKYLEEVKEAVISLKGKKLDEEDTRIEVNNFDEENMEFSLNYTHYKPGNISFLDHINRTIDVIVNKHGERASLEFDIGSSTDHKKISEILEKVQAISPDLDFNFSKILLNNLTKEQKIKLFNNFFQAEHDSWELSKILKLKVKRHTIDQNETEISNDQLNGINSALLDGQNLIDNTFVKSTIENGFYFSMASMLFDSIATSEYLELIIDFKSRPEVCEIKIHSTGNYIEEESKIKKEKNVMHRQMQDNLLFNFQNKLYEIFIDVQNDSSTEIVIDDSNLI